MLRPLTFALLILIHVAPLYGSAQQRYRGKAVANVGEIAPDFELKRFDKGTFKLSDATNRGPVVVWFTNLCRGCQSQIPAFTTLRAKYAKNGVNFVAVSMLGEDRSTVERMVKEKGITYPMLYDPTGSATTKWSGAYVKGTCPLQSIFVIEKGGRITLADHLPGVEIVELDATIKEAVRQMKK
jgi:peroxiredoxin